MRAVRERLVVPPGAAGTCVVHEDRDRPLLAVDLVDTLAAPRAGARLCFHAATLPRECKDLAKRRSAPGQQRTPLDRAEGRPKALHRNLRVASSSGLTVRLAEREDDGTDAVYRLHLRTRRRLGVPTQSRRFSELVWRRLVEPGHAAGVNGFRRTDFRPKRPDGAGLRHFKASWEAVERPLAYFDRRRRRTDPPRIGDRQGRGADPLCPACSRAPRSAR